MISRLRPLKAQLAALILATLIISPAFAAETEVAEPSNNERPLPDGSIADILLGERLAEESVWLGNSEDNRFLGLIKPALTEASKGNVLFIASPGAPTSEPNQLAHMRKSLADFGWNTLLIALPARPTQAIPPRDQISSPVSENLSSTGLSPRKQSGTPNAPNEFSTQLNDWQKQSQQRLEASVEHFRTLNPQKIFVIAEGAAGRFALQFLTAQANPSISGLTLIDLESQFTPDSQNREPPRSSGKSNLAVFEIRGVQYSKHPVLRKKNLTGPQHFNRYKFLQLPPASAASLHGENMLTRRIRGWLTTLES